MNDPQTAKDADGAWTIKIRRTGRLRYEWQAQRVADYTEHWGRWDRRCTNRGAERAARRYVARTRRMQQARGQSHTITIPSNNGGPA